jgi:dTDP-4-amino-4,6-dideoxygalactose transaminase
MQDFRPATALPVTDHLARTHLAIPISPALDRVAAEEVVSAVRTCLASLSPS